MISVEMITITCYGCKGEGKRNYGMVAEGIHPDVDTWYKGIDTCDTCDGKGEIEEPHPRYY